MIKLANAVQEKRHGYACYPQIHECRARPPTQINAIRHKKEAGQVKVRRKYQYRPSRHVLKILGIEGEADYLKGAVPLWRLAWVNPCPPRRRKLRAKV